MLSIKIIVEQIFKTPLKIENNMKTTTLILVVLILICVNSNAAEPLWQDSGRIVISSDGNEHDDDDWAATPFSLALLAANGLQDKVALYTYCDHIWGSNQEHKNRDTISAYEQMHESALRGAEMFGYDKKRFICAVDNAEVAYKAMQQEIEKSSADNPLIIIAAGPMQVVGEALNRSKLESRQYVTVLSHSPWNNNHSDNPNLDKHWWDIHSGWTFDEMREAFESKQGGGVKFILIANQNGGKDYVGLNAKREEFDWLRTSPAGEHYKKGSWEWLYTRLESCPKAKGTKFDVSDSGLIIYMLTGIEKTSPSIARKILENPKNINK